MAEQHSKGERGKRLLRDAGKMVTTATGTLTGKNVEQQIEEYSEVYTQVLLGVHGDLELQSRKVDALDKEIVVLKREIASMRAIRSDLELQSGKVDAHDKEIETLKRASASMRAIRIIAIVAFTIALVTLGVSLWIDL